MTSGEGKGLGGIIRSKEVTLLESGQKLRHHTRQECRGDCCLHGTSEHHVCRLPRRWRSDRQIIEHECAHGVGHVCPGSIRPGEDGTHRCDGCCQQLAANPTDALTVLDDEVGTHAVMLTELREQVEEIEKRMAWYRRESWIGTVCIFLAVVASTVIVAEVFYLMFGS